MGLKFKRILNSIQKVKNGRFFKIIIGLMINDRISIVMVEDVIRAVKLILLKEI